MAQLFTNNAAGLLNASIASTDLSLTLQSGQGAEFPAIGGSDFFLVTLFSLVGSVEVNHEIIKVTARVGDTFTIVRGQEGTNPGNWAVGTNAQLRITAGSVTTFITDLSNHTANTSNPHTVTKTQVGLSAVTNDAQLKVASNLSDVANVTTAKTNLGLNNVTNDAQLKIASNLLDLANASTAKTNLGLGNVTNDAQLKISSNLSDLASASTARTNLGLGSLALSNSVESSITSSFCFRNKIINGNFDIWQRGTSQTSSGYSSVDRWANENVGSTKTVSRQNFTLGQTEVPHEPKYFFRAVVTSVIGTANYTKTTQAIESVRTFAGKTVTLSFWAKADSSKNIAVEFLQYFGTGGTPSTTVAGINSTTISLTTTWTKFTIVAALPSITGKTIGTNGDDFVGISFWLDAGTTFNTRTNNLGQQSGTFDIAQVQLEEGSAATPFEQRPLQVELALCQRYYQIYSSYLLSGYNASGAAIYNDLIYSVIMRSAPTITYISPAYINTSTITTNQSLASHLRIGANITSTGYGYIDVTITAEAEL
jgi:hypothetical protein